MNPAKNPSLVKNSVKMRCSSLIPVVMYSSSIMQLQEAIYSRVPQQRNEDRRNERQSTIGGSLYYKTTMSISRIFLILNSLSTSNPTVHLLTRYVIKLCHWGIKGLLLGNRKSSPFEKEPSFHRDFPSFFYWLTVNNTVYSSKGCTLSCPFCEYQIKGTVAPD